jgi:hypothetical protein
MSEGIGHDRREVAATASPSVTRIAAVGTALVAVNVVLMLVLSYTPVAELGLVLFGNYFLGIGVFVVTVGGGYWLANRGVTGGSTALAGAGVGLTQFGYGLFGATVLVLAPAAWRVPALMAVAGLCFFLGFVADLTYEIWRVKEQRYASVLLSAIGIYVAVMGVFVHVLQWVLRIMSMLDQ